MPSPAGQVGQAVSLPSSSQARQPAPHQACRDWQRRAGAGFGAKLRTGLILGVVLTLYVALGFRLVQIQVKQAAKWEKDFKNQQVYSETAQAPSGSITDRTQLPLAFDLPCDTILADLKLLDGREKEKAQIVEKLPALLKLDPVVLKEKLNRDCDEQRVVYLARNLPTELADKVRALKLYGLGYEDSYRRTYPQGSLACHLIGWRGLDHGMEGVELELDAILRGTPGYVRWYRDASRRLIALGDGAVGPSGGRSPRDGLSVTLTIDARVQQTAEEELAQIVEQFQPKAATCVLMDVSTGAVLAMASYPDFDPNKPASTPAENRRNRVITDMYEPGSTFKTFAAAMALERKLWKRTEMIDCEDGHWTIGYRTLHDAHRYGLLSFDDVIAKSSNIGAAKIALRLGVSGLYETVRTFGFGDITCVNLPGEAHGRVRPRKVWTNDSLYSVAMGHEVCVTPLQLAAAYASVVNGGVLYRPKVVQRIVNDKGEELYSLHAQPVRRVISEQTSQQMREILTRVVQPGGTGLKAFCSEWPIGGKTGTTKKIDPATKTYSTTLYVGSFCGFAPADNPRLVCLVTVDEPKKGSGYYGATVACPAVRDVLRKGLTTLNVPPRSADEQKKAIADVKMRLAEAGNH